MSQLWSLCKSSYEQYKALLSYFQSTEDKQAEVRRIKIVFENPLTKAYLLFLCSALYQMLMILTRTYSSNLQFFMFTSMSLMAEYVNFCCGSWILSMCVLLNTSQVCIGNSEEYLP